MHSQSYNKEAPSHLRSSSYQKLSSHVASLLETPKLTCQNLVHTQDIFEFIDKEVQQCNSKLNSHNGYNRHRNSVDLQRQLQPTLGNRSPELVKGQAATSHDLTSGRLVSQRVVLHQLRVTQSSPLETGESPSGHIRKTPL